MVAVHGQPGESWNGIETEEGLMRRSPRYAARAWRRSVTARRSIPSRCGARCARSAPRGAGVHLPASGNPERREKIRRAIAAAAKRLGHQA